MPHLRQQLGTSGEQLAADFLIQQGLTIITRNYHFGRWAEIDLIARDHGEIVFIEVKTRRGLFFGFPEEAVTVSKQEKIRAAAANYLLTYPQLGSYYRFDVVAITYIDGQAKIEHLRNVF